MPEFITIYLTGFWMCAGSNLSNNDPKAGIKCTLSKSMLLHVSANLEVDVDE
jgi:hypothetical protein